jgi:hypothetical protein
VLERLDNTLSLVDAEDVGTETGGFFRIHYTNFTVFVEVTSENMTEPVVFKVRPTLDSEGTTVFEVDVRDALARYFKDIKRIINPDNDADDTAHIAADGYITQQYSISAYEGYERVGSDGVSVFRKYDEKINRVNVGGQIAVNAVQPYHEQRRDGTIRLDWNDGLLSYVVTNNPSGGLKRHLTHASASSQFFTLTDGHYIAYLWGGPRGTRVKFIVSFYTGLNASGSFISSARYRGDANGKSIICPMGPANITVPANAQSYRFAIFTDNENQLTETFTFNIVDCKGVNKRFYYLNKLGGVDAFTFQGEESRTLNTGREIIGKPHMNTLPGFFNGDWQRRVWRTTNDRRYLITSDYLTPEQIRSVVEPLFESANVWTNIQGEWWTDVLIFTAQTPGDRSTERKERMVMEYGLGVDNVSQRT